MATYAPFLRKLVTAYFKDRKAKDDRFPTIKQVMEEIPVAERDNIAGLLREMMEVSSAMACQHTDVTKPDDDHETCNTCGYKRYIFTTGREEDDNLERHWSRWRKVITQQCG